MDVFIVSTEEEKEVWATRALLRVKRKSKKQNRECTISLLDIPTPDVCPVLKIRLDYNNFEQRRSGLPSLDRKDNTKGYIPGNVWTISVWANDLKGRRPLEEFLREITASHWGEEYRMNVPINFPQL